MNQDDILKKNENIVTRIIGDETILLPVYKQTSDDNCIYTLNDVGSLVWEMIDGKTSIANMKAKILKEFDGSQEEIDEQMNQFISDLKDIGALS